MKTLQIIKDDWYLYLPVDAANWGEKIQVTDIEHDFIIDAFEKLQTAQEIIKYHLESSDGKAVSQT